MSNQVSRIEFDLDLVPGVADLHPASDPGERHRVTQRVYCNVALTIHRALQQTVHFGNPHRQWFESRTLDCEQFTRYSANVFLVSRVDLVAPLTRLVVQILPTGESATGKEVGFNEPKRSFDAGGT